MTDAVLVERSVVEDQGEYASSCGYCRRPGKTSVSHGVWAHSLTVGDYQELLNRGWRRSGKFLYKPSMEKTCCPPYTIRLKAADFAISKGQRRVLRRMRRFLEEFSGSPSDSAQGPGSLAGNVKLAPQATSHEAELASGGGGIEQHRETEADGPTPLTREGLECPKKARTSSPSSRQAGQGAPAAHRPELRPQRRGDVTLLVRVLIAAIEACKQGGLLPAQLATPSVSVRPAPARLSAQLGLPEGRSVLHTSNCAFLIAAKLNKLARTSPPQPAGIDTADGRAGAAAVSEMAARPGQQLAEASAVASRLGPGASGEGRRVAEESAPLSAAAGVAEPLEGTGMAGPGSRRGAAEQADGRGLVAGGGARSATDIAEALAQVAFSDQGLPGGLRLPEGVSLQACKGHLNFVASSSESPRGALVDDSARWRPESGASGRDGPSDGLVGCRQAVRCSGDNELASAVPSSTPDGSPAGNPSALCSSQRSADPALDHGLHEPAPAPGTAPGARGQEPSPHAQRAKKDGSVLYSESHHQPHGSPSRGPGSGGHAPAGDAGRRARVLEVATAAASFVEEEFALYRKYQLVVHSDKPSHCTRQHYSHFLVDTPLIAVPPRPGGATPSCGFGSFHQQYRVDGRLIAVGVVDVLPQCVSSKYLFWDPEFAVLSLGSFAALREIEFVQQEARVCPSLQFYYLGYYIHSCPKMKYKAAYRPSQLLCPLRFRWMPYAAAGPLLERSALVVLSDETLLATAATPTTAGAGAQLDGAGQMPQREAEGSGAGGEHGQPSAPPSHAAQEHCNNGGKPAEEEVAALNGGQEPELQEDDLDMEAADLLPEQDRDDAFEADETSPPRAPLESRNQALGAGLRAAELEQQGKEVKDALTKVPLLVGGMTIFWKKLALLGILPPEGLYQITRRLTTYLKLTGVTAGTRMAYQLA